MSASRRILILGAGTGGVSLAARLHRSDPMLAITVADPALMHYYQPFWTLVGAGLGLKEDTGRPIANLLPKGVKLIRESVQSVFPIKNQVAFKSGHTQEYDILVVATGLELNWQSVEGLEGNLGKRGIISIYDYNTLEETTRSIQTFSQGEALFVMPPVPIKCAGAPQKIMYLAEHIWRQKGIRSNVSVNFVSAGKSMFGIPKFAEPLSAIVKERGIHTHFLRKLVAVDAEAKVARFRSTDPVTPNLETEMKYDLLHVVPTMMAHSYVEASGLAVASGEAKGWLAVDKFSLQHLTFPNIFGIGDVTGIPNSKTGAAIRKQYPVVASNITSFLKGEPLTAKYDGYSSCPLVTEIGKVMLAEFGYDGKLMPSFPLDPSVPRRSYWYLKKDLLPLLYWKGMMKGLV